MYSLHRHKIGIILFLVLSCFGNQAKSQIFKGATENLIFFEDRWVHFGFTLGTNFANFKYQLSDSFYQMDTLLTVGIGKVPGITLGAISDFHLGPYFDLRVLPSLVITQRTITYNFRNHTKEDKNIESIFAEVPVLFKYKSVRHTNVRFYVIGGGKIGYDFSNDAKAERNPSNPVVALKPWNYSYEFGCGLDLYFYLFKFSPEIKLSRGINNILAPYNDMYSGSFDKIFSNFVFISFHFEG